MGVQPASSLDLTSAPALSSSWADSMLLPYRAPTREGQASTADPRAAQCRVVLHTSNAGSLSQKMENDFRKLFDKEDYR